MTQIDLRSEQDGRDPNPDAYTTNYRMGTFAGSWNNPEETGGEDTWAHAGVYCREQFGEVDEDHWIMHERRLVFLGMLVAFVNGDRCAHWTAGQRQQALQVAWRHIQQERPKIIRAFSL